MWVLKKNGSDEDYKLLVDKEYVVGRKGVDIILENDQSISRKHAVITVTQLATSQTPRAVLRDYSKYGTSVNGVRLEADLKERELADGDKIKFGVFANVWRIVQRPLKCCTSCLSSDDKTVVQEFVAKLGGRVLPEWTDECSLLIMDKLTVTIKIVNMLLSLSRVVTPKYLSALVDAAEAQQKDPDPSTYLPPLESSEFLNDTVDFAPKNTRKTIFVGTTFVSFASKQTKKLTSVMRQAGAVLKSENPIMSSLEESLVQHGVSVLKPPQNSVSASFETQLENFLKTRGRRLIPEAEFGLAVLYCSCTEFCNPKLTSEDDEKTAQSSILDTQTTSQESCFLTQTAVFDIEDERQTQMNDEMDFTLPSAPSKMTAVISAIEPLNASVKLIPSTAESVQVFNTSDKITEDEKDVSPLPDEPMEADEYEGDTEPCEDIVDGDHVKNGSDKKTGNELSKSKSVADQVKPSRSSFILVRYASLVRRHQNIRRSQRDANGNGHVKNFKTFKKVLPKKTADIDEQVRRRRPRLEMVKRVSQSRSSSQQMDNHRDDDDDYDIPCTDSAKLFDWP